MGKPTICIGENKGADQLRGNRDIQSSVKVFFFFCNGVGPFPVPPRGKFGPI